jgi:DNA-binding transcriptional ArsR family regulator
LHSFPDLISGLQADVAPVAPGDTGRSSVVEDRCAWHRIGSGEPARGAGRGWSVSAMAEIGALVGDPARMNMLIALGSTSEMSASELARVAGVTPQTASSHLSKLATAGLIRIRKDGRNRMHRLGSDSVSFLLDALQVAAHPAREGMIDLRGTSGLRMPIVRPCRGHIGGRVAVALADVLLVETFDGPTLSDDGQRQLTIWGLDPHVIAMGSEAGIGPCADLPGTRVHIGGDLGRAIRDRSVRLGWVRRTPHERGYSLTSAGMHGFRNRFGLNLASA